MGGTYIQGEGFRLSGMSADDFRYAQRHIARQTGLVLGRDQINGLWFQVGRRSILAELGVVHVEVCIAMVDVLCNRLLGHDWPLNGGDGNQEEDTFFHNFTVAAIAAGYEVTERKAA